jgi:CelD/BcsL family acetyltransferase involved in cellulose biosynthesis
MIEVAEINQLAELAPLRSIWSELLACTANHSFFQTLDWLECTWNHYEHPQKLRVLVVERDGQPLGIVPFCVRTEQRKVGSVRILTYPLNDWGTFFGPVSAEPGIVISAALRHVARTARDWDLIDLRWVDEAAPEFLAIGEAFRQAGFAFRTRPRMEVRLVRMNHSWDDYVESRSRNWRRQVRRDIEQLENFGEVELRRFRPAAGDVGADPLEIYDICERVAENSWQASDPAQSTLSSPRVRDVLRSVHLQAARLGMLDTNILTVGGKAVAFNYNYLAGRRTYGLRSGFDQTAGLENCGKILIYKMLEDAFARGDVEYSFGPGRQPYKDRYATEVRRAYTFRHYARFSLRSQLMNLRERVSARLYSEETIIEQSLVS